MRLAELTEYAFKKYHISEQHKWADFPGFSVLASPESGKWAALLMRQWDEQRGVWIERCDLKCGVEALSAPKPYLKRPFRMQGSRWIGVVFGDETEPEVVLRLFDRALEAPRGTLITLEPLKELSVHISLDKSVRADVSIPPRERNGNAGYRETALPFSDSAYRPKRAPVPELLRKAMRLGRYGGASHNARAKLFYQQAVMLAAYEDDAPFEGEFLCWYPTYRDMNTAQLRGYFTWRTRVRRGEYPQTAASFVYIYVYELLCGVGVSSPAEGLEKLLALEASYPADAPGAAQLRKQLRKWMPEYCVLNNLPPRDALRCADPETAERNRAMLALRQPDAHTDAEVFSALCLFGGKKTEGSPVLTGEPERGARLFADAWRIATERFSADGRSLFALCFGEKTHLSWYPLNNAVYYSPAFPDDRDYVLSELQSFHRRGGLWQTARYDKLFFAPQWLRSFLHAADLVFRAYLGVGRRLRESPEDAWALPFAEAAIERDRLRQREAARERVRIDLSGLEQIRKDALDTQESLLTEAELGEAEPLSPSVPLAGQDAEASAAERSAEAAPPSPDELQAGILRALLRGESADALIRAAHLTPSLAADLINEAYIDEIGDVILECEDERLRVVEEYREELSQLLGGSIHG